MKFLLIGLATASLLACGTQSAGRHVQAPKASAVSPAEVAHMKKAIAPLVNRSTGTLRSVRRPDGIREADVVSGRKQVVIARRNQDGTVSTVCVDSAKGAEKALTYSGSSHWQEK